MTRTVAGPLSGLSVLIVEDEFLIAAEAQSIVEEAGAARALLANSVESARLHLKTLPRIDAVVLDMRLGDDNGGGLMADLTTMNIPFVIASGLAMDHDGAAIVVMKPYREVDLLNAIRLALGRQ